MATAFFAKRAGLGATVLEAADEIGGTCRTFEKQGFRFDSGAHRLHDKDPEVSALVQELLPGDLHRVEAPSRIFDDGRFIEFPLTAGGLLKHLGPMEMMRCVMDVAKWRLRRPRRISSFEDHALVRYGDRLANRYLLNYSKKLWGVGCDRLSPVVSGNRLKGLDLRTFLAESMLGRRQSRHVDGSFLYPRGGISAIPRAFEKALGDGVVHTGAKVAGLTHDGQRITGVATGDGSVQNVDHVVSSLPVSLLPRLMKPAPPESVMVEATKLSFRNVRLVAVFLKRPSVSDSATMYFPNPDLPFTRVAEPRNRCPSMAPNGHTALIAEVPCASGDRHWTVDSETIEAEVVNALERVGLVDPTEVVGSTSHRLAAAYPVLDCDAVHAVERVGEWLGRFDNLHLTGRGGLFMYGWIHDMVRGGLETVQKITAE